MPYKTIVKTLHTYWNIGRLIVEAQGGKKRAKYGDGLIKEWGHKLSDKYGRGYDYTNLSRMRSLFIAFPNVGTVSNANNLRTRNSSFNLR